MEEEGSSAARWVLPLILVVVVIGVGALGFIALKNEDKSVRSDNAISEEAENESAEHMDDSTSDAQEVARSEETEKRNALINTAVLVEGNSTIVVLDQSAGAQVEIKEVTLPESGWVVIHEVRDGLVANALGAARADAGEHTDLSVQLLRATEPASTYVAILYIDNGNGEFDINADLPVVDAFGEAMVQQFETTS